MSALSGGPGRAIAIAGQERGLGVDRVERRPLGVLPLERLAEHLHIGLVPQHTLRSHSIEDSGI